MTSILELEVSPQQERLLKDMLTAMNISFKSQHVDKNDNYSEKEIKEAVNNCFGIWKDRTDFSDFKDFRKKAWNGRGV